MASQHLGIWRGWGARNAVAPDGKSARGRGNKCFKLQNFDFLRSVSFILGQIKGNSIANWNFLKLIFSVQSCRCDYSLKAWKSLATTLTPRQSKLRASAFCYGVTAFALLGCCAAYVGSLSTTSLNNLPPFHVTWGLSRNVGHQLPTSQTREGWEVSCLHTFKIGMLLQWPMEDIVNYEVRWINVERAWKGTLELKDKLGFNVSKCVYSLTQLFVGEFSCAACVGIPAVCKHNNKNV
jgi:hypothetical protein